jgi:hypothetical protein
VNAFKRGDLMRTLDFNRGLVTLLGAGIAGGLIWLAAAYLDDGTTGGYWATYAIIAGAGLVLAASQLVGGWTKYGLPWFSVGVFLLGFLPVAIVVGWIAVGLQPHGNAPRGHVMSWSGNMGIADVVRDFKDYLGVLAFGLGLVLGYCFDTTGARRAAVGREPMAEEPMAAMDRRAADEPVAAERAATAEPHTVPTGPSRRERVPME